MKARNNKTGEIVTDFAISKEFGTISYFDSTKTLRFANACDGEWTIIEEETIFDWQSFRAEAAKEILCSMINHFGTKYIDMDDVVKWTDSLISKLKEKEEK